MPTSRYNKNTVPLDPPTAQPHYVARKAFQISAKPSISRVINPRSHLILLIICCGESKIIVLVTAEIEKEVHSEKRSSFGSHFED